MINKPFKPPLRRSDQETAVTSQDDAEVRPTKRSRPSVEGDISKPPVREPLSGLPNPSAVTSIVEPTASLAECYYAVLWRKCTAKKHKAWTGDGFLIVGAGSARLKDVSGKYLGKGSVQSPLLPGTTLYVSGNEVEVDSVITRAEFLTRTGISEPKTQIFLGSPMKAFSSSSSSSKGQDVVDIQRSLQPAASRSLATKIRFKNPLLSSTDTPPKQDGVQPVPRYDPSQPTALVMSRPKKVPRGKQVVDVVVDPLVCSHLRAHQREGVKFLYDCIMGERSWAGQGAILADEMGLGKTLQTITLLWTLLKQNPVFDEPPVIQKALIVCPATLTQNWQKEFKKWLGNERIGVLVADGSKKITDFTHGKAYSVMIIGYERLRSVQDELQKGATIDIVVADEGHRLKTAQNKSTQAIKALNTTRRIILSGTPIQNDLSEFFVMVDLVNPGALGTYNAFKREFETPIVRSRQPDASWEDVENGGGKSQQLSDITASFILRRTAEHMAKHLPPKTEYVLLCKPTELQIEAYQAVLSSPDFTRILGSTEASLQLITLLRKASNAPSLLLRNAGGRQPSDSRVNNILSSLPTPPTNPASTSASAKLQVLGRLLHHLRSSTQEKVILVSSFTSTLDVLQIYLTASSLSHLRLDGGTPSSKRQGLVDSFNRASASTCFAFLLSAKAGGTGLNLIGASRLVLFEADWNPSTDLQAMARIHREGQKREVFIYRLLMSGGIDEKIWQRQITKMGLADSVMDQKAGSSSFSLEELKDLFTLNLISTCQTHDMLGCACGGRGTRESLAHSFSFGEARILGSGRDINDLEDDDLPQLHTLIKSSKVDMERQEQRIKQRAAARTAANKEGRMQSLMQYDHIDTAGFLGRNKGHNSTLFVSESDAKPEISDDVLKSVLGESRNRVTFIFAKTAS